MFISLCSIILICSSVQLQLKELKMDNFGMSYGPRDMKNATCERCEKEIDTGDKLVMDRKTIHKSCFKCAICEKPLQHGSSGLDERLKRYGPIWLCKEHLLLPPADKEQAIQKKGLKPRGAVKK